jgi:hypothetical protein
MKTKSFVVSEFRELLVMQRVFREAKFCTEADDDEISDSPIVAELFNRLMEALVEAEVELDGEIGREKWKAWLAIDGSRDEWSAALRRARSNVSWPKWTNEKKSEYVKILLSPFVLSEATRKQFISEVKKMQG